MAGKSDSKMRARIFEYITMGNLQWSAALNAPAVYRKNSIGAEAIQPHYMHQFCENVFPNFPLLYYTTYTYVHDIVEVLINK